MFHKAGIPLEIGVRIAGFFGNTIDGHLAEVNQDANNNANAEVAKSCSKTLESLFMGP